MDNTINDLIGEQNDFEFCDDGTNDTSKSSSINEASEDETKISRENDFIFNLTKKKNERSESLTSFKDDDGTTKSFNEMAMLFSELEKFENNLRLCKELPELKLMDIKRRLDRDLEELDFTMTETKATIINTHRLKKQRYFVKKELARMTKNLTQVKQEELQEMELVVAVYDKELLRRWHVAKKTTSPHALEGFINNIVGKRQAVDNVYKMAKDRLEVLKRSGNVTSLPALADKILTQVGITEKEEEPA